MGLGLLQRPTLVPSVDTRGNASTQLRVHTGERISTSFSSGLGSSDNFFGDEKNRKVSLVRVGQNCSLKWLRKQRRNGDRVLELSRQHLMLTHYPTSILPASPSGVLESRNGGTTEKQIMLTKVTKNLVKLGHKKASSGAQQYQEQNNAPISASARDSEDPSPSGRDGQQAKLFFVAGGSGALSAKGKQMWNACKESVLNSIRTGGDCGDFGAGNRDGGGGGGGGGNGDGNGNFESGSNQSLVSDLVENADSQEDDQPPNLEAAYRNRRIRVFASLSSAAGDAIDGEAPFGDPPSGRIKRSGLGEEVDPLAKHMQFLGPFSGAKVLKKGSTESLETHPSGSAGGVVGMLGKNAQDCLNFLAPNHDTVKSHPKQPGEDHPVLHYATVVHCTLALG